MAINYRVGADIWDASTYRPAKDERWLIDSNILFWSSYSSAQHTTAGPKFYQQRIYEQFLAEAKKRNAMLCWCAFSFPEIAARIEKTEYDIAQMSGAAVATDPKQFRHNDPDQWRRVVDEIKAAWDLVSTIAQPLPGGINIDENSLKKAIGILRHGVGGYDLFIIQLLRSGAVTGIVTDDGDFCVVPDIKVVTGNRSVLECARAQGKLRS